MLSNLNQAQHEAVINTEGPVLVLAGAGTGKTTVITNRIAYSIQQNLATLDEILAVTFTNKAANELRERVFRAIGHSEFFESWIGTFHSICLKILKLHGDLVGLMPNFMIADTSDQKQILKRALEYLKISEKSAPIKIIFSKISKIKDENIDESNVQELSKFNQSEIDMSIIFPKYQQLLRESNLVDFDDLIVLTTTLFRQHPDVLDLFQEKFKYVLIDEYQDTNKSQYNLISMLVSKRRNICCVGDDDQSIYSWRGADVGNILNFQKYFKDAKVITLNANYRSTQNILDIAREIISNNSKRYEKNLTAQIQDQRSAKVITLYDGRQEGDEIAQIIKDLTYSGESSFNKDMAVLVRTTAQMRAIEESFIKRRIPYKIIGGVKFYERKEIKDAIAYIKLLLSDSDVVSLERIVNVPKRGVGEKTFGSIINYASSNNLPILKALDRMSQNHEFSPKINEAITDLADKIKDARRDLANATLPIVHIVSTFLDAVGYINMMKIELENDPSYEKKLDNVDDLINNLSQYSNLIDFFDHISLVSDQDSIDESDFVNVMTIHASKGLEFDTVFIPGMEDDLFPNKRVVEENSVKGMEEERRLAYVAITRAKRNLYLLHSKVRFLYGKFIPASPSIFLSEISKDLYQKIDKTSSAALEHNGMKQNFSYNIHQTKTYYTDKSDASAVRSRYQQTSIDKYNQSFSTSTKPVVEKNVQSVKHDKYGTGVVVSQLGQFSEVRFQSGIKMVVASKDLQNI
jgi:DNA helicase II / ATP-dependent DNA helicase PcrA